MAVLCNCDFVAYYLYGCIADLFLQTDKTHWPKNDQGMRRGKLIQWGNFTKRKSEAGALSSHPSTGQDDVNFRRLHDETTGGEIAVNYRLSRRSLTSLTL